MKPVGLIRTGVLFFLIATVVPNYAQQDQHQPDAKPPKQEQQAKKPEKQQQSKDRQQQQRAQKPQQDQKQQQQDRNRPQQQRAQQQRQQSSRPSSQGQRVQRGEQRGVWQQHRARSWESEHRTWQQRGGYDGYRIPQYRYRRYFGPRHPFRIYRYPVVVFGGYPRFQYGGLWFSLMDPWPEYWSDDWWATDDVYIDYYDDGYYLYNRRYPGVRIAITVYVR
jgi:hypothetical protein